MPSGGPSLARDSGVIEAACTLLNQSQSTQIKQLCGVVCASLIAMLLKNNERKKLAIESGVIDALLNLLITYPLDNISMSHIWAIFIFTYSSSNEIRLLLISKNTFKALFRLFDHPNVFIVNRAVVSISNILLAGIDTTLASQPHPHFAYVQGCDGIQKLFALFQKNLSQCSRNFCVICICSLIRAKELPNEVK
ncbi:MAG: hypothetical protein EZS28_025649 [Streblomastix strix]|uniref:Armadillo repeat-containing protein 8 n=1 Tax=Streblomastix strix TaxID=222440 RepID=A0A5J4V8K6_9EUKA|nr:MAG: hypothetical protein EZS28_025649 [Streblomastix strix]